MLCKPVAFKGASGTVYIFHACALELAMNDIGVVYALTKRTLFGDGKDFFEIVYLGQTERLGTAIAKHKEGFWVLEHEYNSVCVHLERDAQKRRGKINDLAKYYSAKIKRLTEFYLNINLKDNRREGETITGVNHMNNNSRSIGLNAESHALFWGRPILRFSRYIVEDFRPIMEEMLSMQKKLEIISPYFFVNPNGKKEGKPYHVKTLNDIWKKACKEVGEDIGCYQGTKHSSCSQFLNEKSGTESELQMITDHARLESVKRYGKTEVARRKQLMEKKVVKIQKQEYNALS